MFDLAIIAVIGLAAFFDIEWRRIPNWLIVFGLIAGIGLNGMRGLDGLYDSLIGAGLGIALFFIPFALRWIGAGDAKYLGVIGAFLGPRLLPRVLWYAILVSGAMAVFSLISRRFNVEFLKIAWNDLKHGLLMFLTFGRLESVAIRPWTGVKEHSVPWGVGISFGALIAYYLDPLGRWAGF